MSKGLGRIQRECLRVIESYESAGTRPTTFSIAAEVYQVKQDRHGNRMINDAQHTAIKRALANLRRKSLVTGQQDIKVYPDGTKVFPNCQRLNDGSYSGRAERRCFWSIARRANEPPVPDDEASS